VIARRVGQTDELRENRLFRFLELGEQISAEVKVRWAEPLQYLDDIHGIFSRFAGKVSDESPAVPLLVAMNAHATFLGAIRSAVCGHAGNVYMALRGAIESSLYAVLMVQKPDLVDVWIKRHESPETRGACRAAFTFAKALAALRAASNDAFADIVNDAYAASIDFGAHPNTKGVMTHVRVNKEDRSNTEVSLIYLYGADSFEVARALLACLETGVLALGILSFAFKQLYEERGIDKDTNALIDSRAKFVKSLGFGEDEKFD
jgi:hypothetical protein